MVESRVGSIAGLVQGHSSNPQVSTLEVVPSQGLDLGELAQGWVELGQDLGGLELGQANLELIQADQVLELVRADQVRE